MNDAESHAARIEGLLFALGKPVQKSVVCEMLAIGGDALEAALQHLEALPGRGVVIVDDGTTLELRVSHSASELVERIRKEELSRDIGRAGLEVLAAIIYRGPLSRSQIDFIRGVNSAQTLRTLTMRGLIRRIANPHDDRSFLYEPTTELLATLGATHARDLPDFDAVREKLANLEEQYREAQSKE